MSTNDAPEEVNAVLGRFGATIGLAGLKLDDENHCQLSIDEHRLVTLQCDVDENDLIIFTDLGQLGQAGRLEIALSLLEANLFWIGTGGATLGLDRSSSTLFLFDRIPLERLDLEHFESVLERVIDTADSLASQLSDLHDSATHQDQDGAVGMLRV